MSRTKKGFIGLYGSTALVNEKCPDCNRMSFVVDGELQCCGLPASAGIPKFYKRESSPEQIRKLPPFEDRQKQLILQEWKCFYCDRKFGSRVIRKNKTIILKIEWDHFIPWILIQDNSTANFVAACSLCNKFKSCFCFDTVESAKLHILAKWEGILDL